MDKNLPNSPSTNQLFEWLRTIGLNVVCLVVGIGIGSFVFPKTRFFVNYPMSIPISSTSTSHEERAHMAFLDQIQGCGSVKGRILWAYVEDQARYSRNEPMQCRLIALEELLHSDHIEACKSQYKKRITQLFVNLFVASTYLFWWPPTFQLNILSDRIIQKFLYKAGLRVHDLSLHLEHSTTIERPLIETFYFFNSLRCIGEAIHVLKVKLNTKDLKSFSDQEQEKFLYDCLTEGFKRFYKSKMIPYNEKKQEVEDFLRKYFYFH